MSEPRWILELLGGEPRTVELPPAGTLVIGSSKERAGFLVEGQGVDETHCAIGRTKEGDWAVKDLGSRNGTMLNGQRVSAARLKLGDQLVLGARRLEVRDARAEAARAAVQAVGSARPADVPAKIGGYRIERLIGKGAMGAVYLAVQESLRRPVALKVLAPKLAADRDFVHRFQAEARAAAALSHPNVVVVYDVGEENGAHYLSMEFMAGGSLEQKLAASGPLPWKTVLAVLGDAAAGLAYAESRGIVHRDIKPANLMYSGTGTVKIADLGLATTLEQEAIEADAVPGGGRKVYGTPHFIAPEQARGQAVDHRSDLYSLGATAYRLLSGKTPFEGATTREILRALQTDAPRPLHELVADLPGELETVVQRLMEKDPAARFPTAEALRRECERLRLVAEHGPTLEVARGSRAQRALVVALLLVVGLAGAAWFRFVRVPEAPRPESHAPARIAEAPEAGRDDASFFDGASEPSGAASDEEVQLRAREREAGQALAQVPAYLEGEDRLAALERVRAQYPGTAAAAAAETEIASLHSATPEPDPSTVTLPEVETQLRERLLALAGSGATLAEILRVLDAFRPPAELAAEFEPRRALVAEDHIQAAEAAVRERFAQATQLALEGEFDELRAFLAGLEPLFAELDDAPGDPARLAVFRTLRDDLAARRARVDEEERFYHDNLERAACRAVGEALGPGSGCLAELAAMDLAAVEARLGTLAPGLRARALPATLAREVHLARSAVEGLSKEFAGGGWRRKSLTDPRSRRVREVREVRADGLLLDRDGDLESLPWREVNSDPDWWHQLFQTRLSREWQAGEVREIVALLRLVGATRGAELAREMLDARARGSLQPAEIEALGNVFAPALSWVDPNEAELRAALELEHGTAQRLAQVLAAAQGHEWTRAAAHLEYLLAAGETSLLVGLLSDGTDWRADAPTPPPSLAPPTNGPGDK
jgi:hypothetical protein